MKGLQYLTHIDVVYVYLHLYLLYFFKEFLWQFMLDIISTSFQETFFISHCTNYLCVGFYKVIICHLNDPMLWDGKWDMNNVTLRQIC